MIRILNTAESDLEEGFLFYESQSLGLGAFFLDSLYADIDSLTFYAGIHPVVFGYYRLLSKRFPFAVYYSIMGDAVLVSAILDFRRNPSWIRDRLTDSE